MNESLIPSREELVSTVERLTERARQVEHDDLRMLAQMHGLCETLVRSARAAGPVEAPVADRATSLIQQLEKLILGEVNDAAAALAGIVKDVAALSAMTGSEASVAEGATPPPEGSNLSQASDVIAGMERVFDDPPACVRAPEPPPEQPPARTEERTLPPSVAEAAYEAVPLLINDKEIEFIRSFVEEALEHISSIEVALLEVERSLGNHARIDDLFRPFHTIKGMAGFLNLRDINCLTHEVETLLDQARKGQRQVTSGLIDMVFDVVDVLKAQIASVAAYTAAPNGAPVPQPVIAGLIAKLRAVVGGQRIPEDPPNASEGVRRLGEHLVEQTHLPSEVVNFAVEVQQSLPGSPKTGEILMDMGLTTARQVSQALRAQSDPPRASAAPIVDQSVRIDTAKLDALVDMVGELVIAQTLVAGHSGVLEDPRLSKDAGQVTKIIRTVQEVVLAMRMIPIGSTFQKMARLVRDVSRKAGKQVDLIISGEDTELDKNVIQQINDPLVHMVRNAVDHGVENAEARLAAGKPQVGRVHLSACHNGGNIVIEISDDGKGLDAQQLIAKGIEKGLVAPGTELTTEQAYNLILAPGFSTAEKVTDISGRGVGMDVVKRNIEQLRGKVEIFSEKGKGTRFVIRLPLTLAIIDGMVVRVGSDRFIIPTIALEQALRPLPEQLTTIQHRGEMVQVRGKLIPLIQLGELFGMTPRLDPCAAMVVIARTESESVGLVVDALIGQQQVVIKSLGERFEGLRGISGGAILGDGRVGLILEMTGLTAQNARVATLSRVQRAVRDIAGNVTSSTQPDAACDAASVPASEPVLIKEKSA